MVSDCFPLRSGTRLGCQFLPLLFNILLELLASAIVKKRKSKVDQKERNKTADDMIDLFRNFQRIQKCLELTNELIKVTFKLNVVFLNSSNEHMDIKIKIHYHLQLLRKVK